MLIDYTKSFAYICPFCSGFTKKDVNIFKFSGKGYVKFLCSSKNCREECVSIRGKEFKYIIKIECPLCGGEHSYTVSKDKFWSKKPFTLSCPVSGIDIFFTGNSNEIKKMFLKTENQISELMAVEDTNSIDLIGDILECLYRLKSAHNISCICGNENVEISIADGNIMLVCTNCGRIQIITPSKKNLEMLYNISSLIIGS